MTFYDAVSVSHAILEMVRGEVRGMRELSISRFGVGPYPFSKSCHSSVATCRSVGIKYYYNDRYVVEAKREVKRFERKWYW